MGISFSSFGRTEKLSDIAIDCDLAMAAHAITINAGGLIDGKDISANLMEKSVYDPSEYGKILKGKSILKEPIVGDVLAGSDDSELAHTYDAWTKIKELTLGYGANIKKIAVTLRIKFQLYCNNSGEPNPQCHGQIRRNGVIVGTEHTCDGLATWCAEDSEDIAGWNDGDTIELWGKRTHTGATTPKSRNFRVYYATQDINISATEVLTAT